MLRALALLFLLLAVAGSARAETVLDGIADQGPLVCRASAPVAFLGCAPQQLAATSCSQTCYDDQSSCHQGCDKAYRGGTGDHDKCIASCSTTYGRCTTRCNVR